MTFTTIRGTGGAADTFAGSNGVDTLSFVSQSNTFLLYGAQANDIVTVTTAAAGGALSGSLNGGAGNDTLTLSGAVFVGSINGNDGTDTITSTSALSLATIQGGQAADTINLTGGSAQSSINGNKGVDTITVTGGLTGTTVRGGQDLDSITVGGAYVQSSVYGDLGNDVISSTATATYSSSSIFGGNGDDNITENAAFASNLFGEDGNDGLNGGGGNDILSGGAGNDTITGGAGNDSIIFGDGTDRANYTAITQTFNAAAVASGTTTLTGIDVITGAGVGDVIGTTADVVLAQIGANITGGAILQNTTLGAASLNRGTYNSSANTFTVGATGIDYLVTFGTNGAAGGLYSVVLDDVGTLTTLTLGSATNAVGSAAGVILA